MSNKIDFELEGVKHSLRFGMTAVEITQAKAFKHTQLHNNEQLSTWDMFIVIIHAGLCNHADVAEINRPTWEESNDIAEALASEEKTQALIWEVFESSKPVKEMMDRLKSVTASLSNGSKKKESQKVLKK